MTSDIQKAAPRVAIVSYPWPSNAPYQFLSDLSIILEPIADAVIIIDGNTDRIVCGSERATLVDIGVSMHHLKDITPKTYSAILWLLKSMAVQLKTSCAIAAERDSIDVVLFYGAAPHHLLPLVTAKVLKKRAVEVINFDKPVHKIGKLLAVQNPLFFRLLDGISPISEALIHVHKLDRYSSKLLPEGSRYIDTSRYTVKKRLAERRNVVGFISRFRKEKGLVEFINAIPTIYHENEDTTFLIGGSGDLDGWVTKECERIRETLGANVILAGWIGEELPEYLNQLKLFVLPTKSEALPTILLQAMACGTPVLAPAVGGITDIVKDRETGFLLPEVDPQCIAKSVTRILARSGEEMDTVVRNGLALVHERYSYEAAVERYRTIVGKTR